MVSMNRVQDGIASYIERELCPQMNGWKKAVVATAAGLALRNFPETMRKLPLGLANDNEVDVEAIYNEARKHMDGSIPVDIPYIGTINFSPSDLDTLYNYIMRG